MEELSVDHFDAFYRELHGGSRPFPWQRRLMREVAETGRWPGVLDLPTGTGKTTALEIAVFALALEADRPASLRRAPRRTVFLVDRRTVVDQAYERALAIAGALRTPSADTPVLGEVAERLLALAAEGNATSKDASPLGVHLLRGGMPRDDDWARSPTQPLVAVSTVDQVGSRLLFRGYGISHRMRPVHAGLLANDALLLLDEVHLARPFRDLLMALEERYRNFDLAGLPNRWQVVQMSATVAGAEKRAFTLSAEDYEDGLLAQRLGAQKPTALTNVDVDGSEQKRSRALVSAMVAEAKSRVEGGGAIGIVVNRVKTARMIFDELDHAVEAKGGRIFLVTGRMRPIDRGDRERELKQAVGSGRDRGVVGVTVVVATQCIEAGADFDFDTLLTECASLDALRQRFGRLDRLGKSAVNGTGGAEGSVPKGMVFVRSDQVADKADEDPIYGDALRATWRFLQKLDRLDFGIQQLTLPSDDELFGLLARGPDSPVLLPAHLDAWVQTSPPPQADPEPALWLHGTGRDADVSVVWRADLQAEELGDALSAGPGGEATDRIKVLLEACPPRSMEAVTLPIAVCRSWLREDTTKDVSDAGALSPEDEEDWENKGRPVVLWRGDDEIAVVIPNQLRPGDVVVVPSRYGGLRSDGNWDPESDAAVPDYGDRAQLLQRGRVQLRLVPEALASALLQPSDETVGIPGFQDTEDVEFDPVALAIDFLRGLSEDELRPWARIVRSVLVQAKPRDLRLVPLFDGEGRSEQSRFAIALRGSLPRTALRPLLVGGEDRNASDQLPADLPEIEATTGGDYSSLIGVEVTLKDHLEGVGTYAREYAAACGLSDALTEALGLAGDWHDFGKADPRFQQWLHQGSAFKAGTARELLAKSAMPNHPSAREQARKRAKYPKNARHELMSVALISGKERLAQQTGDHWDLVQYLIASHHGWCRPFAPFVPDSAPAEVSIEHHGITLSGSSCHGLERLDSGIPERFWRLIRVYGWYGLAWLEALFRLADHRCSETEARPGMLEAR